MNVVKEIDDAVAKTSAINYKWTCFREVFLGGIEFGTPYLLCDKLKAALKDKDKAKADSVITDMKKVFADIHNKDYDHEVDRKVAKALLPLYAEMVPAEQRPSIYSVIEKEFKGDYNKFVDACYDNSIFANQANFDNFVKNPSVKVLDKDLMTMFVRSKYEMTKKLNDERNTVTEPLTLLHKTYVRGLGEMKEPTPSYPDANFTIRLTYGNVKSYNPKDGVHYNYFTTMKGIMEKEDPNNPEFVVPAKLKELYNNKDFGRYALKNGEMPVCFLSTNDITGGNSGSPVINGKGQLIGAAFDGNWESLSGDINFDNDLQRCICVDIRYILFIVDKLGNSKHLIDEMTIVE
jgi:Peptidase S46.